ncbi:MAG: multidrug effflux MFS transporter [Bacteroidia bacterium]|nr:multidrug effflux MFS transporter [Bacteroidia bacterium]
MKDKWKEGGRRSHGRLIVILGFLSGLIPFSIDMYLPAFPAIATGLHTDTANVGISLASFFVGICAGQVLYGPLMDRYGRRKPLLAGMGIYLATSLACIFVTNVEQLIALRFMQAFGGCATFIAGRAVVRDVFPSEQIARVFSLMMLVMGVAPVVAPIAGGIVVSLAHWRVIFITLSLLALVLLAAVYFLLPESKGPDTSVSLRPLRILQRYGEVMVTPGFLPYTLASAFGSAALFAYISASPQVFMELFGLSERYYGMAFAFNAACLITGGQLSRVFMKRYSNEQISLCTGLLLLAIGLFLAAGTWLGYGYLPLVLGGLSGYLFIFGINNPNTNALSLKPFVHNAGAASSLSGVIQMSINASVSFLVSWFADGTARPMVTGIVLCAAAAAGALIAANVRSGEGNMFKMSQQKQL